MKKNINPNESLCRSQASKILLYMLEGNKITGIDALELFGCFRLPARISDIKKSGFNVEGELITTPSGKRVKAYWIDNSR